jgi:hypothetical protein
MHSLMMFLEFCLLVVLFIASAALRIVATAALLAVTAIVCTGLFYLGFMTFLAVFDFLCRHL